MVLYWGPNELHPDHLMVDEGSGNIWRLPPCITWAVAHSHLSLLKAEIQGDDGIRALSSIIPYINLTLRMGTRRKIEDTMCYKLFRIAVVFNAVDAANAILFAGKERLGRDAFLEPYVDGKDLTSAKWIISLESFGSLEELRTPLVELACQSRDEQALNIAIARRADVDLYVRKHPMALLLERFQLDCDSDLRLITSLLKAGCSLKDCGGMSNQIYRYFYSYLLTSNATDLEPFMSVMRSDEDISINQEPH